MAALSNDLPMATGVDNDSRLASMTRYRLLGNTGLRVSPLAYGAGTFGDAWVTPGPAVNSRPKPSLMLTSPLVVISLTPQIYTRTARVKSGWVSLSIMRVIVIA